MQPNKMFFLKCIIIFFYPKCLSIKCASLSFCKVADSREISSPSLHEKPLKYFALSPKSFIFAPLKTEHLFFGEMQSGRLRSRHQRRDGPVTEPGDRII